MKIDTTLIVVITPVTDASTINIIVTTINAATSETITAIIKATNDNAVVNDAEDVSSVSIAVLAFLQNSKYFFQLLLYFTNMNIISLIEQFSQNRNQSSNAQ